MNRPVHAPAPTQPCAQWWDYAQQIARALWAGLPLPRIAVYGPVIEAGDAAGDALERRPTLIAIARARRSGRKRRRARREISVRPRLRWRRVGELVGLIVNMPGGTAGSVRRPRHLSSHVTAPRAFSPAMGFDSRKTGGAHQLLQ
jgi:hypothetical protein